MNFSKTTIQNWYIFFSSIRICYPCVFSPFCKAHTWFVVTVTSIKILTTKFQLFKNLTCWSRLYNYLYIWNVHAPGIYIEIIFLINTNRVYLFKVPLYISSSAGMNYKYERFKIWFFLKKKDYIIIFRTRILLFLDDKKKFVGGGSVIFRNLYLMMIHDYFSRIIYHEELLYNLPD